MAYLPFVNPATKQDLRPNTFSAVGGGTANQTVFSAYDLYKPNELVQVFERHHDMAGFRLMLKAMGFTRGTAAPTVGHYEYPWRDNLITVGSIITASTGPGTNVVIALDAADMYDPGVSISGTAQRASYPIVGEILMFRDGSAAMIIAKDTTTVPTVHRLTLRPLDSTVDLATSVVAAESYFVTTNAWGEGTDLPAGRVPRVIQYHNDFQIVKTACSATGSEMTNEMYFEPMPGKQGSLYIKAQSDMYRKFEQDCDGALLWGQNINNITIFNANLGFDVPVRGTEGLIDFATTNGNVDNYVAVGGYTMSDFRDLARYYQGEQVGTNSLMCLMGFEIFNEVEEELIDMLDGDLAAMLTKNFMYGDSVFDNMESEMVYKEPAEFALKLGVRAVKIANFNFCFRQFQDFNKKVGAGADGYDYKSWQIVLPVGYSVDKGTNTTRGTFGYEYKQQGGYSRENIVGEFGGAGIQGKPVNASDIHRSFMISEFAFHATCANHITIQKPQ